MFRKRRLTVAFVATLACVGWATLAAPGGPSEAANPLGSVQRVTLDDNGNQLADGGNQTRISANGRWAVFVSPPNGSEGSSAFTNVYVRDLKNPGLTVRLSWGSNLGNQTVDDPITPQGLATRGDSFDPTISGDGRLVAFDTTASNIVPTDNNEEAIVVCDRDPDGDGSYDEPLKGHPGVPTLRCFNAEPDEYATNPALSEDGTHLAFDVANADVGQVHVVTLDAPNGAPLSGPTDDTLVQAPKGVIYAYPPAVSNQVLGPNQDGVRVAFPAYYSDNGYGTGIFATDVYPESQTTRRVDVVPPGGTGSYIGNAGDAAISDDGSEIAFDASGASPVAYVASLTGSAVTTEVVSQTAAGTTSYGLRPALSGDGRYVAFLSTDPAMTDGVAPPNANAGDCNGDEESEIVSALAPSPAPCQVVVRDLAVDSARATAGKTRLSGQLASPSHVDDCGAPSGAVCDSDGDATYPVSLTDDGARVAFNSVADDLVAGDTNQECPFGCDECQIYFCGPAPDGFVQTWQPALKVGSLDFGPVKVGTSVSRTVTVSVSGFGPIEIGTLGLGGADAGDFTIDTDGCANVTLHETEMCLVSVTFTPSAVGQRNATLDVFPPGASAKPTTTRPVTGAGSNRPTPGPQFSGTPNPVAFGTDIPLHAPGKSETLTVTNPGTQRLTISGATVVDSTVPGASGDYSVDVTGCASGAPPGGSCQIVVTWIGQAVGARPATLIITDNAPSGKNVVGLTARVPKPKVLCNPDVSPGGRVITVSGTGFAPHRTVKITFLEGPEKTTATTNGHGRFSTPLVIFNDTDDGGRTLMATMPGASSTIHAQEPFLISLGTVEAPTLQSRNGS